MRWSWCRDIGKEENEDKPLDFNQCNEQLFVSIVVKLKIAINKSPKLAETEARVPEAAEKLQRKLQGEIATRNMHFIWDYRLRTNNNDDVTQWENDDHLSFDETIDYVN